MPTENLNNAQCFVLNNAHHSIMISRRKRKWRYVSKRKGIKRLRKEDGDIHKFVIWCKEVGIRISKQVFNLVFTSSARDPDNFCLFYCRYHSPGAAHALTSV